MLPQAFQPYAIILILCGAMGFFIWKKWRYEITAILALVAAVVVGAVPLNQVFSGIDNPAVITVASIMIITHVIAKSNVLNVIINKLDLFTAYKPLHIFSFSFFIAILSAFMNNVGALGLMLPVSIYTSLKHNRSPSHILMPIAMASALGGMVTLIGTPPNLLIANFRAESVGAPFHMFDFSYVGLGTALIGLIFLGVLGWRLLPERGKHKDVFKPTYISEIRIHSKSKWVKLPFKELQEEIQKTIAIVGLIRRNKKHDLSANMEIKSGDRFIIETTLADLQDLSHSKDIIIANRIERKSEKTLSEDILLEAIVPTRSKMQGKTLNVMRLKRLYQISIIAISQVAKTKIDRLRNLDLQAGDMVLVQCKDKHTIDRLPAIGLIPITEATIHISTGFKVFLPLIIFAVAILLVALTLIPVQIGFAAAAFLTLFLRPRSIKYVYERFDWSIIILLAAMIPVGDAFIRTGGATIIAQLILGLSQHLSVFFVIALVMLITMFLSDVINNAATAIVMSPIAISLAHAMQISVDPLLMAVAIGASCAFLTPIGHQNNLLVMGPGKYKFFDYTRVGLPLEIIVLIVATPLIYWFWYR